MGSLHFNEDEKHKIIQELISTQCTKAEIWEKYTGEEEEHGQLLRWMRQLGYNTVIKTRRPDIVSNLYPMAQKKTKPDRPVNYHIFLFLGYKKGILFK